MIVLQSGSDDACAYGFCEDEDVTGLRTSIANDGRGIHLADDAQPIFRLRVINRMAANDRDAGGTRYVCAAAQNILEQARTQMRARERDEIEREQRTGTHRIDVGQGIGCSNTAEIIGIINDRSEKIRRRDQRAVLIDLINGRVIPCTRINQNTSVAVRQQSTQNLR